MQKKRAFHDDGMHSNNAHNYCSGGARNRNHDDVAGGDLHRQVEKTVALMSNGGQGHHQQSNTNNVMMNAPSEGSNYKSSRSGSVSRNNDDHNYKMMTSALAKSSFKPDTSASELMRRAGNHNGGAGGSKDLVRVRHGNNGLVSDSTGSNSRSANKIKPGEGAHKHNGSVGSVNGVSNTAQKTSVINNDKGKVEDRSAATNTPFFSFKTVGWDPTLKTYRIQMDAVITVRLLVLGVAVNF